MKDEFCSGLAQKNRELVLPFTIMCLYKLNNNIKTTCRFIMSREKRKSDEIENSTKRQKSTTGNFTKNEILKQLQIGDKTA